MVKPFDLTIDFFSLGKDVALFIVPFFKFILVAFEFFAYTAHVRLSSLYFLADLAVLNLGLRELTLKLFDALIEFVLVSVIGSMIRL